MELLRHPRQLLRVDSDKMDLDVQAVAGEGQLPRHLTSLGADTSTKPPYPRTRFRNGDLKAEEAAARQTSRLVEDFETVGSRYSEKCQIL